MTNDVTPADAPRAWALRCALVAGAALVASGLVVAAHTDAAAPGVDAAACLPLAIVIGGALALVVRGTPWLRSGAWLAAALIGQAACLQLTLAGTTVRYQRFQPWGATLEASPVSAFVLGVEIIAVSIALWRHAAAVRRSIRAVLPGWRAPALALLCLASVAAPNRDLAAYVLEIIVGSVAQVTQLGAIVLVALSAPPRCLDAVRRLADRILGSDDAAARPRGPDRLALAAAAWVFLVSAALATWVYQLHPHIQDEAKYLLQARYLAAGRLGFPLPPVMDGFAMFLMEEGPHGWYAVTPPGWPAALAAGLGLGVPWLVNPALAAANVLLTHALLRRLVRPRTARLATLLLAASPWFLFLAMSLMSHQLTLMGGLLAALGVERARHSRPLAWTFVAGLSIGVVIATRQLDGAIVAVLAGLWAIGLGGKRLPMAAVMTLVGSSALVVAALLLYNTAYTGEPLVFPIMAHIDRLVGPGANAYGFGPDRGMGWVLDPNPGHGPVDGTINGMLNIAATNVELFGWGFGSLALVYALVLRGRLERVDRLMIAVVGVTFTAYFFNYFSGGPDFGARYWFLMVVPGVTLTARAIRRLGTELAGLRAADAAASDERDESRALLAAGALLVVTVVTFLPWRSLDRYVGYRSTRPQLGAMIADVADGPTLVLVRGREIPDWTYAAILNPFDVNTGAVVYAWDVDADVRRRLLDAYPDRTVWLVDGPSRAGDGYRVADGPLTVEQARRLPFDDG